VVAALLITLAAISANLGVVLTALEARRQPAHQSLKVGLLVSLVRRPLWRLAALLDLGGWGLKTAALLVAPLTVVAPAMSLGLFLLLVFSSVVLGEKVRASSIIGVALLAGGVALVALHSPAREVTIAGPIPWIACGGVLLLGALAVFIARGRGLNVDVKLMALSCGFAWALNGILSKLMADAIDSTRWTLFAVALVSAFSVGGIGYLAKTSALQAGEATTVESIVGVVNTLVPVALAPILFGEEWPTDPAVAAQLAVGLVLVGVGVWLLTHTTARALERVREGEEMGQARTSP
jgi:uncharacterized membrane protein